ncbi:MAG: hypothetical protein ACR2O5_02820 [Thiogranum sp.]
MTFILDMSSGKECPGEELSSQNQRAEKTLRPDVTGDDDYPALQLATIETTTSVKQPASTLPDCAIDLLLKGRVN